MVEDSYVDKTQTAAKLQCHRSHSYRHLDLFDFPDLAY